MGGKEEWRDIPEYEGIYQVSSLGNIKSLRREVEYGRWGKAILEGKTIKPVLDTSNGYYRVCLRKQGSKKTVDVHRIMALVFLGHSEKGSKLVVDHKDNDRTNNKLENLQIITTRENTSKNRKGTSKYTGVSWDKDRKKWLSCISLNNKTIHLGRYVDEEEAHKAYQSKLKEVLA